MNAGLFNPGHYAGSEYVAINMAANTTPLTMHFIVVWTDAGGTTLYELEQFPVIGWVTVAQLDDDGRILDTEILPGFFEAELQQVVTARMWTAYGGNVELVAVLPTGEEPDPDAIAQARMLVARRRAAK